MSFRGRGRGRGGFRGGGGGGGGFRGGGGGFRGGGGRGRGGFMQRDMGPPETVVGMCFVLSLLFDVPCRAWPCASSLRR